VDALSPFGKAYTEYREFADKQDFDNQFAEKGEGEDKHWFGNLGGSATEKKEWVFNTPFLPSNFGTLAIAGKRTPIQFDNPFSKKREHLKFTPRGVAPTMTFNHAFNHALTIYGGTHLNGWDINAVGKIEGIQMLIEGTSYITNSKIYNYRDNGVHVFGNNEIGKDRILYISDSEIIGSYDGGPKRRGDDLKAGLYADRGGKIYADNVKLLNNRGNGAFADSFNAAGLGGYIEIKNSVASGNSIHGLLADYNSTILADNMLIEDNVEGGAVVGSGSANFAYMEISNSALRRNGDNGLIVNGWATLIGRNLTIEDSGKSGVAVWGKFSDHSPEQPATLRLSDSTISGSGFSGNTFGANAGHFGILINQQRTQVPVKHADVFLERVTFKDNLTGSIFTQVPTTNVTVNDSKFFDDTPFFRRFDEGNFFGSGNTDENGNPVVLPTR